MRIISGNVRQNLPPDVAALDIDQAVASYSPDIICLQEATAGNASDPTTGYLGAVATNHGMKSAFAKTRHFVHKGGDIHSGVATLVREEVAKNAVTREIELNAQRIRKPWKPIGRRALLITTVEEGDRPLHIVNAHLSYPKMRVGQRHKEWKKVFEIIDGLMGDVVISGDFNARPGSRFIQECNRRWKQVSDQSKPTFRNLYKFVPKVMRDRTIDYVYTNRDCQREVTSEQLVQMNSDHIWHAITIKDEETKKSRLTTESRPQNSIVSFTTSHGSVYTYDNDGHTTRFKKATGKEQPQQDITVFIDLSARNVGVALRSYLLKGASEGKIHIIEYLSDGEKRVITDAKDIQQPARLRLAILKNGKVIRSIPASLSPEVGKYVFEMRQFTDDGIAKTERHLGHKVTHISYRGF